MRKAIIAAIAGIAGLTALLSCGLSQAADLTEIELRWLRGISPVIAFARETQLALDIVVQPQPAPGAAPLALAFVNGRCKLVLSMRGNDEAQATLDRIEPALLAPALELMAAHELGHCRRHLDGSWRALPAGYVATVPETLSPALWPAYLEMQATRREEAYGDLAGLAWTWQRHPQQYAKVHAWLVAERSRDLIPGSHHDTLAWLGLARPAAAAALPAPLDGPMALWAAGHFVHDQMNQ